MKAIPNMHETVINNWKKSELRNIKNAIRYFPTIKGYRLYKCKKCGLKTKFNVPEGLDKPNEQIGNEIIQSKKTPKKIFCPICMLHIDYEHGSINPKTTKYTGDTAVKEISNNTGYLEQASDLLSYVENETPSPEENIFCLSMSCKEGIPIYRQFIDILKE